MIDIMDRRLHAPATGCSRAAFQVPATWMVSRENQVASLTRADRDERILQRSSAGNGLAVCMADDEAMALQVNQVPLIPGIYQAEPDAIPLGYFQWGNECPGSAIDHKEAVRPRCRLLPRCYFRVPVSPMVMATIAIERPFVKHEGEFAINVLCSGTRGSTMSGPYRPLSTCSALF